MRTRIAVLIALISLLSSTLFAQSRTYAGTFNSRWRTVGPHGHDQPLCGPEGIIQFPGGSFGIFGPDCNPIDFAHGNLDDSMGFRAGKERDFATFGPLSVVGGVEGSLSYTEYNLTQADFTLLTAAALAGADLELGGFRVGGRFGVGPFATSDGNESGFAQIRGVHLNIPLGNGVALRVSRQTFNVIDPHRNDADPNALRRDPRAAETSMLLVTSPDRRGPSAWEFSASTGTTTPGGYIGSSRGLRSSAYSIVSMYRDLPWTDLQGRVSWSAAAHESTVATTFRGFPNNYRSKTISAFGVGVGRAHPLPWLPSVLSIRYGAGLEAADWRDNYQLLTRNGEPLQGGVELGVSADVALRWNFRPHLAFETTLQKVYWHGIDVGEGRIGFGLVVTR
jgi:hypothetical protein